jgi:hypothetical protein
MVAISGTIAAVAAVAGVGLAAKSAFDQADAQEDASRASQRQQESRKKQQTLDAQRARRAIIRQSIRDRAQARSNRVAAGVSSGSSVANGADGQIQSAASFDINAVNENEAIGTDIFREDANIASARADASQAQAIGGIGNALFNNAQTIGNLTQTFSSSLFPSN